MSDSANQIPTVTVTADLATKILMHLRNGGDRISADLLADQLQAQANAPLVEAQRRQEFERAVAAAVDAKQGGHVAATSVTQLNRHQRRAGKRVPPQAA